MTQETNNTTHAGHLCYFVYQGYKYYAPCWIAPLQFVFDGV